MQELTNTRHNELIDPSLHVWGWEIPVYLFLGGLVAGMMIITGYYIFKGKYKEYGCVCRKLPLLSIIILSIGMLFLFLDLEYKVHVWRMYMTFKILSPMSWGAWILLLVYPALIAALLINVPVIISTFFDFTEKWSERINNSPGFIRIIGITNIALGIMLGIYTGVLLSAFGARPLWNSSILSILFLISGLSTAAAFVHMIANDKKEKTELAKADNTFIGIELVLLALFIIGLLSSSQAGINGVMLILNGKFAAMFWVFVVGFGLIIPLIIQLLAVNKKIKHAALAPVLVLFGGLMLRFVIVFAGQFSHWTKNVLMK
jgi:formate-dependent nitrite reductase membrane component NrfD